MDDLIRWGQDLYYDLPHWQLLLVVGLLALPWTLEEIAYRIGEGWVRATVRTDEYEAKGWLEGYQDGQVDGKRTALYEMRTKDEDVWGSAYDVGFEHGEAEGLTTGFRDGESSCDEPCDEFIVCPHCTECPQYQVFDPFDVEADRADNLAFFRELTQAEDNDCDLSDAYSEGFPPRDEEFEIEQRRLRRQLASEVVRMGLVRES